MKTQTVRLSAVAACLAGAFGFTSLPATAAEAYGSTQPYTLSVDALQDVTHHTDVVLTVTPADGYTAPSDSSHVQLKSFDTAGHLQWTQNTFAVALTPNGAAATAVQSYSDMVRYQPVDAFVQMHNDQSVAMQDLSAHATVKLRPDLEADTVTAPPRVRVNELVNIGALIRELNGDLGATTDVQLYDGSTTIDTVAALPVLAHGSSSAVFTTKFSTTGTHTLTVVAANVAPGDYDGSNNARTFTIDVINPAEPVHYTAQYTATRDIVYDYQWSTAYSSGETTAHGSMESATLGLFGIAGAPSDITNVTIDLGADGTLNPARHYQVGSFPATNVVRLDNHTFLYANWYWATGNTSVQLYTWGGDYVYFSQWYDYYWGTTQTSSYELTAPALNATTSFDAQVIVTSAGQQYGGSLSVPLTSQPVSRSWNDPSGSGSQSYTSITGYGSGMTQ